MSTDRLHTAALTLAVLAPLAMPVAPAYAAASETRIDLGAEPGTIVIKTAERKLYLVTDTDRALVYDIAVGKPSEQWFGKSWVSKKREAPTWTPTPSMREKNPRLPQSVAPGPNNPLGERAINLGWGAYRIHGTNKPQSIGSAASAGCFRMRNGDVKDLFERVHVGAEVRVLR
ncbi:MAG: L,D-transpeptidase [Fulvimarina manganoxydans]|uniref:L,D-transpeptidase n=1 Tax=Fulvimarina manganoxydans TaxID=937218 RepID=UPI002353751F|nr:L,D-transpeptidase [Fulvimarina manganoxydans]MCK5934332.1 L,D-transpeptidase [Fulvimarina manganoxydans]